MKNVSKITRGLLVLIVAAALAAPAAAWDNAGHEVVAQIALDQLPLHSHARSKLLTILAHDPRGGRHTLVQSAIWPDTIKRHGAPGINQEPFFVDAEWHFIDIPYVLHGQTVRGVIGNADAVDPSVQSTGNVVTGLQFYIRALRGKHPLTAAETADAVSWVTHLAGDIHQPLHCVSVLEPLPNYDPAESAHGDRGGNGFEIVGPSARQKNLHAFWDDILDYQGSSKLTPDLVREAAGQLESSYGSWARAHAGGVNPAAWAEESYGYRAFVYSPTPGAALPQAYIDKAADIGLRRITLAGYRLANIFQSLWP